MSIYSFKSKAARFYYKWNFSADLLNNSKAYSFFFLLALIILFAFIFSFICNFANICNLFMLKLLIASYSANILLYQTKNSISCKVYLFRYLAIAILYFICIVRINISIFLSDYIILFSKMVFQFYCIRKANLIICHKPSCGYSRSAKFMLAEDRVTQRTMSKCLVENQNSEHNECLALCKSDTQIDC